MGKIKGMALIPIVKALRSMHSDAVEAVPGELRYFLSEKIFPSGWYSEDELMVLLQCLVELLPPRPDIWEWMGAFGAKENFSDIYASAIYPGRPELGLKRYPRIWRLYHDNGRVAVSFPEPGRSTIDISAYLVQRRDFCRLQAGHFQTLLELAGARDVEVQAVQIAAGSRPARWRLRWKPPERS